METRLPVLPTQSLTLRLCGPRGFCAGVDRAIQIVVLALKKYGAPVYVRHEIVHNRYVVEGLEARGAVFVKELDEIPPTRQPVIFSAHGVPKSVPRSRRPPQSVLSRRDLPAGLQGPQAGACAMSATAAMCCSSAMPAIPKSSAPWGNCRPAR